MEALNHKVGGGGNEGEKTQVKSTFESISFFAVFFQICFSFFKKFSLRHSLG